MKNSTLKLLVYLLLSSLSPISSFAQISRAQVITNALQYTTFSWTANTCNIWKGKSCNGKNVYAATWVNPGTNVSMPYAWGGFSSISQHTNAMANCESAGDICSINGNGCSVRGDGTGVGISCASGLDCSGFVSRAWGLSRHYGTGELPALCTAISPSSVQQGDIFNKVGDHTRLVYSINGNGSISVLEASAKDWKTSPGAYMPSQMQSYTALSPNSNIVLAGNSSQTPPNDNCSTATQLTSYTTANYLTNQTVNNATPSGKPKAKKDNYTNPSLDDVWYSFQAMGTSSTITVDPAAGASLDAVVAAYNSCADNNEIDSVDPTGTGTATLQISTIPGNTYYIRIYDYGQTPTTKGDFRIAVTHTAASAADLIVQNPSVQPNTIAPGGLATVSFNIKNQGSGNAVSTYTAIWLSKDMLFNGGPTDVNLNKDVFVPSLNSGQVSGPFSQQIKIPDGTASGTWYIMLGADALNVINNESNENNNQSFVQVTINSTVAQPPSNDNCSAATQLTSYTSATYLTNQTVNNATPSGKLQAEKDHFTGTPSLDDVWYSFIAMGTSSTITVDPASGASLDAVVAAYNSCSDNNEIDSVDPDGSGTATLKISTIPGTTYYVRVYDYGKTQTITGNFRIAVTHEQVICTDIIVSLNPANQTVNENYPASFTCSTSAGTDVKYQWQYSTDGGGSWNNVQESGPYSGTTSPTLSINSASADMNGYQYRCSVHNDCSSPNSSSATLMVNFCQDIIVASSPVDQNVPAGSPASFTCSTSAGTDVNYQWEYSTDGGGSWNNVQEGSPYSGTTSSTLSINSASADMSGYQYRCHLSNICSSPPTSPAILTVTPICTPVVIASNPANQNVLANSPASFTCSTLAGTDVNYQWAYSTDGGGSWNNIQESSPYSGTISPTLSISSASADMNGYQYRCSVHNSCSSPNSSPATLTVNSAPPTFTFDPISPKTYGDPDFDPGASGPDLINYTTTNAAVATVVSGKIHIAGAGTTNIAATAGTSTVIQSLTVAPATIIITANHQTKAFGTPNPELTLSYAGFVNGDTQDVLTNLPTISTAATETSNAGTYPINATGATAANYIFTYIPGELTITSGSQSITFAGLPVKAYGDADFEPGASSSSGLQVSYISSNTSVATILNGKIHIVSAGTAEITASQPGNSTYPPAADVTVTLNINPATLTITANDLSKTYGELNPSLTLAYAGFVNGDNETKLSAQPVITTACNNDSPVGTYFITIDGAGSSNYTINYVQGKLTVNPATITVKAEDKNKIAGEPNPVLTVKYSGFVNGEDVTVLTTKPVVTTVATNGSKPGDYPITANDAVAPNYIFNYVPGVLKVNPIPAPNIKGFSPSDAMEGTVIIITGVNLSKASAVSFGGIAATSVNVISSTQISAVVGKGASGKISVTTPGGISTIAGFNYVFVLSADNFKISTSSVTCKGSANGAINITAVKNLDYTAFITGEGNSNSYDFTTTKVIPDLPAGKYNICIKVKTQPDYQQCFDVVITEPKDLKLYSTINQEQNTVSLTLDGGSVYNIKLNGKLYSTSSSTITLPLNEGNNQLEVSTDKICQGIVQKLLAITNTIVPFPDPFQNTLNINLGNKKINNLTIEIRGASDGKKVFSKKYQNQSGIIKLDVASLNGGVYGLHLTMDGKEKIIKIIKK